MTSEPIIPQSEAQPQARMPLEHIVNAQRGVIDVLNFAMTHDPLTGLRNKVAWQEDVEARMSTGKAFCNFIIDLDGFKRVNDEKGHGTGDTILISLADHLNTHFRRDTDRLARSIGIYIGAKPDEDTKGNLLSRWAGDEFALTFSLSDNDRRGVDPTTQQHKSLEQRTDEQGAYLRAVVDEFINGLPDDIKALGFGVSIGKAYWDPEHPVSAEELFNVADADMFKNKEARKAEIRKTLPLRKRLAHRIGKNLMNYSGIQSSR